MKPQFNVRISQELIEKVEQTAERLGVSKPDLVEAALLRFLMTDREDQKDTAINRKIDIICKQFERLERNLSINTETLALYVRFFLTVTPPLEDPDQDGASLLGKQRFEYFIAQLGRRLAGGGSMIGDALEEISKGESEIFTDPEIEALRIVRADREPQTNKQHRETDK